MAMNANLIDAETGEYIGKIVTTKYVSNGVKLFDEGGTYRFQVDTSLVNWTLRVEQLTKAEAETYKPKEPYSTGPEREPCRREQPSRLGLV